MPIRSLIIITLKDSHPHGNVQGLLVYDDDDNIVEAYMHDDLNDDALDRLVLTPAVLTSDSEKDIAGVRETINELRAVKGMRDVEPWQVSTRGVMAMVEKFRKKHT